MDLRHGEAGIAFDGDERLAGLVDAGGADEAKEVPGGVFDVVGVYRAVQLELLRAAFEFAGVVEGDAALPVVGLASGVELDDAIEVSDGFFEVGEAEVVFAATLIR